MNKGTQYISALT